MPANPAVAPVTTAIFPVCGGMSAMVHFAVFILFQLVAD
jgi:hypothetical protein